MLIIYIHPAQSMFFFYVMWQCQRTSFHVTSHHGILHLCLHYPTSGYVSICLRLSSSPSTVYTFFYVICISLLSSIYIQPDQPWLRTSTPVSTPFTYFIVTPIFSYFMWIHHPATSSFSNIMWQLTTVFLLSTSYTSTHPYVYNGHWILSTFRDYSNRTVHAVNNPCGPPPLSKQAFFRDSTHSMGSTWHIQWTSFLCTNLYVYNVYNCIVNIYVTLLLINDFSSLNERSEHFYYPIIQTIFLVNIYF